MATEIADKPLTVLVHSNSSWVGSGYGTQTDLFTRKMAAEQWTPIISAFYGHRGKVFKADGIVHLPGSHHDWGEDIMFAHYEHYKPDAFVLLIDVWVYANDKLREIPNLTSWCPIDHVTIPPQVQEKLEHCRYVWSMSRHGQRLLDAAGIRNTYVPHGVDTAVYTPVDRASARETLSFPADAFVAVCVAANKGYPDRKQLRSLLKAWSVFVKAHPDAVLYLHTDAYPTMGGVHVHKIAEFYGIPDTNLVLPDVYRHVRGDYSPAIMNLIYNAADVFILPSAGEGFGIPVVEAQAAGTPVIVTDATAQAELCGAGWKIPIDPLDDQLITLQYAEQAVVKPSKIVAALEQAYAAKGDEAIRAKARAFALQYDVDTVWNEYMKPAILAQVADRQSIEGARVQRTEARLKLRAGEPFSPYPTPCACNTPGAPFCNSDCEYAAYAAEGQSELEAQE